MINTIPEYCLVIYHRARSLEFLKFTSVKEIYLKEPRVKEIKKIFKYKLSIFKSYLNLQTLFKSPRHYKIRDPPRRLFSLNF